jgi:predicted GNAT family N-acyltransferase
MIELIPADWHQPDEQGRLMAIRMEVFVVEQKVPEEIERDELDPVCSHLLAVDGDQAVATGRMTADGHIGRLAVLKSYRGQGIGRRLVQAFVERAVADGLSSVDLNAQTHARGFYEKLGFEAVGDEFIEAGIAHLNMVLIVESPG